MKPNMPHAGSGALTKPLRRPTWRSTLTGILIGLLIAQVFMVKWLAQSQVDSAQERNLAEAAARVAQARCLETASPRTRDACRVVAAR
ncbi:MAG: ral secretion pathway protein GspL [Variovorax sp.]|jgi:hypothetical protein|nr:ral secretion pathway protein GspL [Variovorax sp.]